MSGEVGPERLEELVLNSSASTAQLLYDGWLVRLSPNDVKRARSVTPVRHLGLPLGEKIDRCEELYRRRGLPPLFRLSSTSQPANLDTALAAAGYEVLEPTLVQVADLAVALPALETAWDMRAVELDPWVDEVARMRGSSPAERDRHLSRMLSPGLPTHQVGAYVDDQMVACGAVIFDGDHAGVLDMLTLPALRRRGAGSSVLAALLAHARAEGARRAWLGLVAANEPAVALYNRFGFQTRHRYWYRVKP